MCEEGQSESTDSTEINLPDEPLDLCAKKLLNTFGDKIEYSNQWYCVTCKIFVNLSYPYMRNYKTCLKSIYIFYKL